MLKGLLLAALTLALLAGCAPAGGTASAPPAKPAAGGAAPPAATAAPAAAASQPAPPREPLTVRFGDIPSTAHGAVYIAMERGYFREEGIEVSLEVFDTAERMIPALATNQLEVAGGGVNAGMFSAIARGLPLKIVGGITRSEPGMSSSALMVRKELIDAGRVRDYADLRGLRISLVSATSGLGAEYSRALELGGLTDADVDFKQLSFPDAMLAMTNGAIDAAMMTEPFVARLVQSGAGVRWKGADEIYPGHQITTLLYGQQFRERHPEAAVGFLVAYIRGARDYNAAMRGGDRTPIYQILTEYTPIKDLSIYSSMVPSGIHPNAEVNVQSLEADQNLWASQGHIPQKADLTTAVDLQYHQAALRRLDGPR